jgi:hypothetical protein
VAPDRDGPPTGSSGAAVPQRAADARRAERGRARTVTAPTDVDGDIVGAGDSASPEVYIEAVLGEKVPRCGGRLGLAPRGDVGVFEPGLELARAISVVPVYFRLRFVTRAGAVAANVVAAGAFGVEDVGDEIGGDAGVAGVAGGDDGGGDDLAVGVDRNMALVAVELAGRGLMAFSGDQPVVHAR